MDKKTKKEPGVKEWAIILAAGALLLLLSVPDLFRKEKEETVDTAASVQQSEKQTEEYDARLPEAIEIVLEAGQASVSMLQRRMRVGYARAGRLIDDMYQRGIVSEADGAKPRAVLITREQFNRMFEDGDLDE